MRKAGGRLHSARVTLVKRLLSLLKRSWKLITTLFGVLVCLLFASFWELGTLLCAPAPGVVGNLPPTIRGENVQFQSGSGSKLRGWFLPGTARHGAVVLMHGVRGDRNHMLKRAVFLNKAGYSVLLFDFQAHGESSGKPITFGHLESEDAKAAVAFVRARLPAVRIAVLGSSLGGAAAVLASPPLKVDGMILEMVYPSIEQAAADRLAIRFGEPGRLFAPLLTCQLRPRIGVDAGSLRPIDHVSHIEVPKLIIGGSKDQHTTLAETRALFDAAADPKELWIVEGAAHTDMYMEAKREYEERVLAFLGTVLH